MKEPKIRIENIEDMKVIYIRFRGTYVEFRKKSRSMFNKLFEFAKKNDLVIPDVTKVITIYHDNPFITDEKNLRTSVAMTVPSGNYLSLRKRMIWLYQMSQKSLLYTMIIHLLLMKKIYELVLL
jgi:DNA gyrase inhibitor